MARGSVKKRGNRWRARYPDPLRPAPAQIERMFKTRDEANAWVTGMAHSTRSGTYIDPGAGKQSFAAVADEYRTTWADLEPRTKAGYDHILKLHLLPTFGGAKVSAITPDAIQRYVNGLSKTRSPNTVRRIYGVLRKVMETAANRRYIALNPCDPVRLPKPRPRHGDGMVILTPAEINALADAIDPHYRTALYVAATCGLRAGELWGLRRKDVDVLTGTLHVRQALKEVNGADPDLLDEDERGLIFGPPKSAASQRKLSIPARPTRPLLEVHLSRPLPGGDSADALIFTTASGLPVRHGLFYRRVFKPAVAKALPADKQGLRWHDLRHTAASLSLAVSPNLTLVKQRLGHADIATTVNTYGHMVPSVDEALAEGLSVLFDAAEAPADNVVELR